MRVKGPKDRVYASTKGITRDGLLFGLTTCDH